MNINKSKKTKKETCEIKGGGGISEKGENEIYLSSGGKC